MIGRSLRVILAALVVAGTVGIGSAGAARADPASTSARCSKAVLIVSAMPLELNPLVAAAKLAGAPERVGGHDFYSGTIAGVPVVMTLSGIGPANARETATAALEHFRCQFAAALFSGVAGTVHNIGDVMIPSRWTVDGGRSWIPVDAKLHAVASRLDGTGRVHLLRTVPTGDAACLCGGVDLATPVSMPQPPRVWVGGSGTTSDPFGGHAVPCVFGGGDVAGCEPCILSGNPAADSVAFAGKLVPLLSTSFVQALTAQGSGTTTDAAVDEETGAVDQVAHRFGVPFLGIRGASDGNGDPLHTPGFPVSFFVYRQLAADNAAAATVAFLRSWSAAGRPTELSGHSARHRR
ncbi:MAG: hypothetical protein NVSMB12_06210 [Acidimicrobiales bacterium]